MARGDGLGRWAVRGLAALGALIMVLGAVGWWLSTRVLEPEGFADVVAKSSQQVEVRDYIADQASLRLARTSNFVSAARPVVSDAISAAVLTPPVEEAIRDFAQRAHEQVFQARGARRVDVNSQEAAVTIRSTLQTINPSLAKKLPANVLDATTTISQSDTIDVLFHASRWIEDFYIPCFFLGVGLLILAMVYAREPSGRSAPSASPSRSPADCCSGSDSRRRRSRVSPPPTTRCEVKRSPRSSRSSSGD